MKAQEKRNLTSERLFGVEIEFFGADQHEAADAIRAAGVPCYAEGYNHDTRDHWKIVTDSSCGLELVSPPLRGEEGYAQIETAVNVLVGMGARVNRNCGLHVHHDARDLNATTLRNFAMLYTKYEHVLDSLQPNSRRASINEYCQSNKLIYMNRHRRYGRYQQMNANDDIRCALDYIKAKATHHDPRVVIDALTYTRFQKVNFSAWLRHGTVEVRHAAGTLNARKIIEWVKLTGGMVTHCTTVKDIRFIERATLGGLLRFAKATRKTGNWFRARQAELAA